MTTMYLVGAIPVTGSAREGQIVSGSSTAMLAKSRSNFLAWFVWAYVLPAMFIAAGMAWGACCDYAGLEWGPGEFPVGDFKHFVARLQRSLGEGAWVATVVALGLTLVVRPFRRWIPFGLVISFWISGLISATASLFDAFGELRINESEMRHALSAFFDGALLSLQISLVFIGPIWVYAKMISLLRNWATLDRGQKAVIGTSWLLGALIIICPPWWVEELVPMGATSRWLHAYFGHHFFWDRPPGFHEYEWDWTPTISLPFIGAEWLLIAIVALIVLKHLELGLFRLRALNMQQRLLVLTGIMAVAVLCLFPPWEAKDGLPNVYSQNDRGRYLGRLPIWDPPEAIRQPAPYWSQRGDYLFPQADIWEVTIEVYGVLVCTLLLMLWPPEALKKAGSHETV